MKKGYTMAEALVTLVIIGTLTAITIPLIKTVISNNDVLYKTAFQITEKVLADLTQDLTLYPTGDLSAPSANNFCTNFAARVNTIGTVNCTNTPTVQTPSFTTVNGMRWFIGQAAIANFSVQNSATIWVDLNGTNPPNSDTGENRDIFLIHVSKTGKVTASGATEIGYLSQ